MNHHMKNLIGVLIFCLTFFVLVACGNEKGTNSKGSSNSDSKGEKVEKVHWFSDVSGWGPSAWNTKSSPFLEKIETDFKLTFDFEAPPTDASTKLGLMITTDDLPDIMSITDGDMINRLIDSGKVWNLEEFFEEYDADSHLLKTFPEDIKKALIDIQGDWYSLPSHMESVDNREVYPPNDQVWKDIVERGSNSSIIINKEIMEQLNISETDLKTEDGFYKALEKVKSANLQVDGKNVIPFLLHGDQWLDFSLDNIIAWNFGAVPVDENGKYRHMELSPGYKNALKFINTTIQKEYLDINTLTIDETVLKTYIAENRVFALIGNQANFNKEGLPLTSFGPIRASNGAIPNMPINKSAGTGWIKTLISKDAKHPEKIAKMLSWSTSKDGLLTNYFGEEIDYEIEENGVVTRTEEGEKKWRDDYKNNQLLWPFANTSFERSVDPVPTGDSDAAVASVLTTAYGSAKDTYVYDSSLLSFIEQSVIEPSSDLGIKLSQIENYLESQKGKIITAKDDATFESEYQAMVKTLKDYSVEDIDSEFDKYYQDLVDKIGDKIEDVNADLY